MKIATAHPCDPTSLEAVFEAAELGLIEPILVGPQAKIAAAAAGVGKDLAQKINERASALEGMGT